MEDLRAFNIQYWFTLMKDGNYIQVEGKVGPVYSSLYRRTIADMILYEPIFITYNDKEFKAYSDIYFEEKYFYEFQLSSPYNSITKEYYPSYFVYLFFDDNNAIKNVPPYYGGNLLSPALTGKWKGVSIEEPNNYIIGEYYGNNNIILTPNNDIENSISISFELLNRQLLNLYIRTDNDKMTIKFQKEKNINGTSNSLISNILSGTWAILDIDAVAKADYNGNNTLTLHGESEDEIFIVKWDLKDKDTLFIVISNSDNDVSTILFTRIKE
jgi:hypothetical protein